MRLQPVAITSIATSILVFFAISICLSTCQATFVINSDGGHHNHQKNRNFAMAFKTKTKIDDSAVLTELKDTIRRQALEIEHLKKTILVSPPPPPTTSLAASHGAHGGAPIDDGTSYMSKSFLQIDRKSTRLNSSHVD